MRLFACLALVILLAGCTTPEPEADRRPDDPTDVPVPLVPDTYASACPPSEPWRPNEDSCVATMGRDVDAASEPAAARWDDQTFAVAAISDRSAGLAGGLPALPAIQGCTGRSICVWVTEDGGGSWTESNPPAGEGRTPWVDPTMAYDDHGRLHLVFLFSQPVADGTDAVGGVAHVVYEGATWSEPTELSFGEHADRPWLGVEGEEIMIVWHDPDQTMHTTYSRDGGSTWTRLDAVPACNVMSRPVWDDRWHVACADRAEGGIAVQALKKDHWTVVERLPGNGPAFLAADGGLVVGSRAAALEPAVDLSFQASGWTTTRVTAPDASWTWMWLSALDTDGGVAHMILVGGDGEPCFSAYGCDDDRDVWYVAAAGSDMIGSIRLTPEERDREGTKQWFNDFDTITVEDGEGVAFWGDAALVHWTKLVRA